jgi:ubiquitin-protein ligase
MKRTGEQCAICHPNIGESGSVCLEVLKTEAWTPKTNIIFAIMANQGLLDNANPGSPVNWNAVEGYRQREQIVVQYGVNSGQDRSCPDETRVRESADATKQQ